MAQKVSQKQPPKKTADKPWFKFYPKGVPRTIDYQKISLPDAFRKTVADSRSTRPSRTWER